MANVRTRLPFLAMERSLRATGCTLPLWVIPYNEDLFDLPRDAQWWSNEAINEWLRQNASSGHASNVMRKYQCLLEDNYLFVDSDVIFLRNPQDALSKASDFVTFCCHWTCPIDTTTESSLLLYRERSTTWQRWVFNSGQFACDKRLYDLAGLIATAELPEAVETCLKLPYHEQPGVNLLVLLSGRPINNLTLPPLNLESSWAGHYKGLGSPKWGGSSNQPFLLHWAGRKCDGREGVDELMLKHLSNSERLDYLSSLSPAPSLYERTKWFVRDLYRTVRNVIRLHSQSELR